MRIRTVTGLICGLALLFAASPVAAQDPTIGVKAGLNLANLSFDPDDEEGLDNKPGLVVGVFVGKPIRSQFGIQVEALFSQKGAKSEFSEEGFTFKQKITLDYIEIPVLGDFRVATSDRMSFHVLAGPTFGFLVNDKIKQEIDGEVVDEGSIEEVTGSGPKKADVGFAIGGAVKHGKLVFDVRYTFGLMNLDDDPDSDQKVKTRTLTFSVGWIIR